VREKYWEHKVAKLETRLKEAREKVRNIDPYSGALARDTTREKYRKKLGY
jgi:hypothetical protein